MRTRIKMKILKNAYPIQNSSSKPIMKSNVLNNDGINLIGFARAEMGIGESCRLAARSLEAADIPFGIINFYGTNSARMTDTTWIHKEVDQTQYGINVFHINAEQMIEVYAQYGNDLFNTCYNIGFWHWELPDFPDEWMDGFRFVNEIWAPSSFVVDSIAIKSPVPVVRIPHGIEVRIAEARERSYFDLPERAFLFLTMYDVNSHKERKNPIGAIQAFKQAFDPDNVSVGLVVKINNLNRNPDEEILLKDMISDYRNIYLIKDTLSRNDVNALLQVTDCYISLHRSEGFGLGLAEAMYLGKPVIGTNWSANTDFMRHTNSCLVDYELVQIGKDYGQYKSYQYWAEPDLDNAGYYMKKLVADSDFSKRIALQGERTIKNEFSPRYVGNLVKKRINYLKK